MSIPPARPRTPQTCSPLLPFASSEPVALASPVHTANPIRPALDTLRLFDDWELNASWQFLLTARPPKRQIDATLDDQPEYHRHCISEFDMESGFRSLSPWSTSSTSSGLDSQYSSVYRAPKRVMSAESTKGSTY
ncbi:hypothetical protein BATDEDRAFT_23520 [Batrachochytrium dendrobatidis JAM81]|uniref:Uncharacterized protein n=2 Tax=Batrachochytrium dendrobatidis TaxID=109871 RepID=F4NZ98_BATDJ|nr:uncharacterized protein BATDEDRAFT_23520 [Batrachochytrium dendrobatidis JAM81]EGF81853.1 hypothetical protein BATDEDRAFT_23520 [Batrachochytrium dendrobatidis JAM81]KAJ8324609.1 hypothetical protein O5D80_006855 [Batrachochytrium dendrobatidis]|eukprot:XP_006677304.1 hypothetical protein BATDEDRAFT_23520 [Batrachochytrium dendrobatidis JAM81]